MMIFITIYCAAIKSKKDFYSAFDSITPSYFGNNLDALHDVLTEINGVVRLTDYDKLHENLGSYADGITRVLNDSKEENSMLDIIIE